MRTMRRIIRTPFIKRMVFLAGILIVILLVVFALNTLATAKRARAAQIETHTTYECVLISCGDSLWSIAQKYRGSKDIAVFVEELKVLNGLSSDRIQAGSSPVSTLAAPSEGVSVIWSKSPG